jgi:hypothetical protein
MVSFLWVTQNPRHESRQASSDAAPAVPAAFLAGLILPHQEVTGVTMSKI